MSAKDLGRAQIFVVSITAARRYAASSVDFKAFVQGTRIKGASRRKPRALPCRPLFPCVTINYDPWPGMKLARWGLI
jgi:hypothetical protein